jgi:hypothetical protein
MPCCWCPNHDSSLACQKAWVSRWTRDFSAWAKRTTVSQRSTPYCSCRNHDSSLSACRKARVSCWQADFSACFQSTAWCATARKAGGQSIGCWCRKAWVSHWTRGFSAWVQRTTMSQRSTPTQIVAQRRQALSGRQQMRTRLLALNSWRVEAAGISSPANHFWATRSSKPKSEAGHSNRRRRGGERVRQGLAALPPTPQGCLAHSTGYTGA